jgi:CubicO group peptidase (beta-lactamase class C family)
MQKDDLFWIASMTKPMTAVCVLMLQEEGKLSIDEPVEKYLPEFKNQWMVEKKEAKKLVLVRPKRPITVRDLLTHTAGLGDVKSPRTASTLGELTMANAREPLQSGPGLQWSDSNPGINTLGRLIEVASGQDYAEFMEKRIFKPLGMRHTTFWPDKKELSSLATSYKPSADGKGLEPVGIRYLTPPYSNKKRAPLAAGGLFSAAEDLLKLYQMILDGGVVGKKRLIRAETLQLMATNHTGEMKAGFADGMGMGLGFQVVRQPSGVTKGGSSRAAQTPPSGTPIWRSDWSSCTNRCDTIRPVPSTSGCCWRSMVSR